MAKRSPLFTQKARSTLNSKRRLLRWAEDDMAQAQERLSRAKEAVAEAERLLAESEQLDRDAAEAEGQSA